MNYQDGEVGEQTIFSYCQNGSLLWGSIVVEIY